MSEILHLTRDYEVSVWTLQDSFITVLGASSAKYRGRLQNPEMKLVNDGTQEFTFSIPMYLDDGINRIKNPIWTDVYNASVIAGMRKIKVIFNKGTDVERVFEFIITKVTKSHENDKPQCDVNCEGLAFHELGKIGYKIEFSTDVLAEENYQWYIGDQTDEEPIPTMDYWNQKKLGLELYPQDGIIDARKWYYKVEMDWSSYANGAGERSPNKIYEEEYTIAWDSNLLPKDADSVITYKEKSRVLNEKESNIYNLTQKLAETFGVFCRYDYGYDDNYHIISRTVVYYNTGIKDRERKLSFTYPYSSTKISREDDSIDIITKMYVKTVEDQTSDSGLISITNSEANPMHEDYLLNFDYLKEINTITQEQYDAISAYEKEIRRLNDEMIPLQNELLVKEDRLPRVEALRTVANNAKTLDAERLNNSQRLRNALVNEDGVIVREGMTAKQVLMQTEVQDETYYFNAPENGIIANTIRIYKSVDKGVLTDEIENIGKPELDEFGNLAKMVNIPASVLSDAVSHYVYLTYSFSPKLYYERIEKVWAERLAKDEADYLQYNQEYEEVDAAIKTIKAQLEAKRANKQDLIKDFEHMMGPALREGYWTPDNYNVNTGEKYTDYMEMAMSELTTDDERYNIDSGESKHTTLLWDTERFEDEQKSSYELGIQQNIKYYPCIELTPAQFNYIQNNLNDTENNNPIGILYYDYIASEQYPHKPRFYRSLTIGASAQLGFVYDEGTIKPVLLLTDITNFTDEELTHLKSNAAEARFGYLTTSTDIENGQAVTIVTAEPEITHYPVDNTYLQIDAANQWLDLSSTKPMVYLRCKIDSLALKNNETDLNISYNGNLLKEFEDYYVFQRVDNATESNYYITFKPEIIFKYGYEDDYNEPSIIAMHFVLSNASTAVYLDAREILKENSKPKVTYTVDPSVFYEDFIYTEYNALNTIAFINDYELEFEWVQGYISEIDLNLDFPGEDTISVKNYKNKFEDLFSTIVAQTEAMEKNEGVISSLSKVISADGSILGTALQGALKKVDLNYAFNNGKLTISEKDGIWGISDDGVVAFRGGGIFTSTQKDINGNWVWNTGIVPQGINANLITAGQLDTNKVMLYAGDRLRFQLNGDGLFAYKSFLSDFMTTDDQGNPVRSDYLTAIRNRDSDIDYGQYVVMNEDGLFLKAHKGSFVINDTADNYIKIGYDENDNAISPFPNEVERVSLTWNGLKMRNWNNDTTFFASANSGELFISGTLNVDNVFVSGNTNWQKGIRGTSLIDWYENRIKISESLADIFDEAGEILIAARESQTAINAITQANSNILSNFLEDIKTNYTPTITNSPIHPEKFKTGDIWNKYSDNNLNTLVATYVAMNNWDKIYDSATYLAVQKAAANRTAAEQTLVDNAQQSTAGWNRTADGRLADIQGAAVKIDTESGDLVIEAAHSLSLLCNGAIDISGNDVEITGSNRIKMGSASIELGTTPVSTETTSGHIYLVNTWKEVVDNSDVYGTNTVKLDSTGIEIAAKKGIIIKSGDGIDIYSSENDNTHTSAVRINKDVGVWIGSGTAINLSASDSAVTGSLFSMTPERILIGVTNTNTVTNTSAIDITKDYVIITSGSALSNLESTNITQSPTLSGIQIKKDYIGLATTANISNVDYRSLISITPQQILIGAASTANNAQITENSFGETTGGVTLNGSYIKITNSDDSLFEVGSSGHFIVRTPTFFIDNKATGTDAILALRKITGNTSENLLLFNESGLSIKGNITATGFHLTEGASGGYSQSRVWYISERTTPYDSKSDQNISWESNWTNISLENNQGKYLHTKITSSLGDQNTVTYDVQYISEDGDEFTISGIGPMTWNGVAYDVAITSTKNLLIGANGDDSYSGGVIIARDGSHKAVEINKNHINFDYSSDNYIHMDSTGIDVKGNRIQVNGDDVWARDDIIVISSTKNEKDAWRAKMNTVEEYMTEGKVTVTGIPGPNDTTITKTYYRGQGHPADVANNIDEVLDKVTSDWVVIQPYYDAHISIAIGSREKSGESSAFVLTGSFTSQQSFATSTLINYTYGASCELSVVPSGNNMQVSSSYLYLSNSPLDGDNCNTAPVAIQLQPSRYLSTNPTSVSGNVVINGENANLFSDGARIYYCYRISGTPSVRSFTLDDLIITASCPATTSRVPCTVYYYPKSNNS